MSICMHDSDTDDYQVTNHELVNEIRETLRAEKKQHLTN